VPGHAWSVQIARAHKRGRSASSNGSSRWRNWSRWANRVALTPDEVQTFDRMLDQLSVL